MIADELIENEQTEVTEVHPAKKKNETQSDLAVFGLLKSCYICYV